MMRSSIPRKGISALYSRDIVIIQITWVGGKAIDEKKRFYKRIADENT